MKFLPDYWRGVMRLSIFTPLEISVPSESTEDRRAREIAEAEAAGNAAVARMEEKWAVERERLSQILGDDAGEDWYYNRCPLCGSTVDPQGRFKHMSWHLRNLQ